MLEPSTYQLEESDVRLIVSMLAEVAAMSGDHAQKKRWVLERLSEAVGADKWMWALRAQSLPGDPPSFAAVHHGGFTPEQLTLVAAAAAHPCLKEIDAPFAEELARVKNQLTMRHEDYDTLGLWPKSPAAELSRQAGVSTILFSTRPMDDGTASVFAFYRPLGAELYSDRDRQLAHLVLCEVNWLHQLEGSEGKHAATIPDLSRRHLVMLSLLIQGNSRKEMAELMKISQHTVNGYVKIIFKHFEVQSQTELMRQFIFGDGNDTVS